MFYNGAVGTYYNGFTAIAGTGGVYWSSQFDRFKLRGMQNKIKTDVVEKLRALEY